MNGEEQPADLRALTTSLKIYHRQGDCIYAQRTSPMLALKAIAFMTAMRRQAGTKIRSVAITYKRRNYEKRFCRKIVVALPRTVVFPRRRLFFCVTERSICSTTRPPTTTIAMTAELDSFNDMDLAISDSTKIRILSLVQ